MTVRAFLFPAALLLAACPTTPPPADCATRCAAVTVPASICLNATTARDFVLRLDACAEACSFTEIDQPCQGACVDGRCVANLTVTDAGAAEVDAGATVDAGQPDAGANACENLTCAAPPANACVDASTLRIFDARGVCASGQCLYGSRDEACASGCANGACQNNPCQGVTCTTPPASVCTDATTLKSSAPQGTCAGGACRYAETFTTCQFGCASGRCVNDPCAGVSCSQPPAPFCASTTTLRTFPTSGVCASGSCLYAPTDTTCPFGCASGRCVNDPCAGVSCTTPPASACLNATTLRTFGSGGVCSAGSCLYSPTDSTCQFGCANGACVGNPCQGVTCSTPPAATCLNPTTLRTFSTAGTCSGGACSYAVQDTACQFGCVNGRCTNNPCQGVTCNAPPASTCVSATTLRTFSSAGTCTAGACSYASSDALCAFGCANGACTGNPCQGVSCNTPPAPACLTPTTLRTFTPAGTCTNGACSYAPQDTTCPFGCANGACTGNPCQGVTCSTPPANTCLSTTTLRTFNPAGTCSGGACTYASQDTTCPFGCANGACTGNPCQGVTCATPPASTCVSPTTLRTFSSSGTCAGGACTYGSSDTTCPFGCASGACVNDPCQGVTCSTPPARTCLSPTTLRTFSPSGTCSGGGCSYTPSDMQCAFGCVAGACVNDPCQGVTCSTPPATTCVGSAVRTFAATGTCASGACSYGFSDTPCPGGCSNGACQAPTCGGVSCNAPPAPSCVNANRLRTAFPQGTCSNNTCSYTQYEVLCSQGCLNGACIAGSWTVEFMPQAAPPVLINGQVIHDASGEPIQVGCEQSGSFGNTTSNGTVRLRRRTASGWLEETVDTGMGADCQARVALDANGEPMMAWYDSVNRDLRFALRNGGTWAPKELVANQGDVGFGASLRLGPSGTPWLSYVGVASIQFATRATNGTWTSEAAISNASFASKTALRIEQGAPWILTDADAVELATKGAGAWSVVRFSDASSSVFGVDFRPDSFTVSGGVAGALVTDGAGWVYRTRRGGQLYSEPFAEEVEAVRTDGPIAAYLVRSGTSPAQVIRARQNEAWPDALTAVPYATQLFNVVSYSGGASRHVLMDTRGRQLKSPSGCVPRCSGRTCGEDGCGGSCGTCATGFCAPAGTCSALRSQLLTGLTPQRAEIAAGATSVHVIEEPSSFSLAWRSLSAGTFSPATRLSVSTYGLFRESFGVVNEEPLAMIYAQSTTTSVLPYQRTSAGTWTSGAQTTASGDIHLDAAGTAYKVRCTSFQVYLSTLPAGAAAWTPETSVIMYAQSGSSSSCQSAVSPSGQLYVVYEGRLYSNAPGFTTRLVPNANGRLGVDAQGNLHLLGTMGAHVWRPATNTLESDTALPGVQFSGLTVTGDRTGRTAVVALDTFGTEVVFARRTATATWAIDRFPLTRPGGPFITNGSTVIHGLTFDGANTAHVLLNDTGAWRHLTR